MRFFRPYNISSLLNMYLRLAWTPPNPIKSMRTNFEEGQAYPLADWDGAEWRSVQITLLGWLVTLWAIWSVVFYLYFRNAGALVERIVSWLLKGSVLELLIAVPCHVFVRHREDCSAPAVTSFGIVTGIAVMLLSFGPSVLFLYKKRLGAYKRRRASDVPL